MKITSEFKFYSSVQKYIKNASGERLLKAAQAGGHVIMTHAKINAEKNFSGASTQSAGLSGSIIVQVDEASETSASVNVGPTVVYGRIQELGGVIKPVFARMLHWVDPKTGEHRVAGRVTIPPRPYLRPAVDENISKIIAAVEFQLRKGL